jgi:predicted O-methyltransferase YrrM
MSLSPALEALYNHFHKTPADTNEHLPTLRQLASECEEVVEIGCWEGVSTTGLFCGLIDGGGKQLRVVDINSGYLATVAARLVPHVEEVEIQFIHSSSLDVELDPAPDMLFIDSWHTYDHLSKELAVHGDAAKKYLVFHDTVTYGEVSEDKSKPGLMAAIDEFMEKSGKWKIKEHFKNNNGLLILERL